MIVKFVAQARVELTDAVAYYEGELSGLVYRFWEKWTNTSPGSKNHEIPQLRTGGYRRVNLKIFPYYISYIVRDSAIWILAIAHGHTRPEYWIDRPDEIK